jgi:hypothetical protein
MLYRRVRRQPEPHFAEVLRKPERKWGPKDLLLQHGNHRSEPERNIPRTETVYPRLNPIDGGWEQPNHCKGEYIYAKQ